MIPYPGTTIHETHVPGGLKPEQYHILNSSSAEVAEQFRMAAHKVPLTEILNSYYRKVHYPRLPLGLVLFFTDRRYRRSVLGNSGAFPLLSAILWDSLSRLRFLIVESLPDSLRKILKKWRDFMWHVLFPE
jgi:hypothetical protein